MDQFSYELDLTVRFRDLDPMGHVNNAVYASYLEHARTSYIDDVVDHRPEELGIVLANLELNYKHPIEFREQVTVGVRTTAIGRSSIEMVNEIRIEDDLALTAESVIVTLDEEGKPKPVPENVREQIAEYEGL